MINMINGLDLIDNYPKDIDIEMIPLLNKINSINGFRTQWSCCGHNYTYPYVTFITSCDVKEFINEYCKFILNTQDKHSYRMTLFVKPFTCILNHKNDIKYNSFILEYNISNKTFIDFESLIFEFFNVFIETENVQCCKNCIYNELTNCIYNGKIDSEFDKCEYFEK